MKQTNKVQLSEIFKEIRSNSHLCVCILALVILYYF